MSVSVAEILRTASLNLRLASEGDYPSAVDRAIDLLSEAFRSSHTLLIFGNGGSSADAEHLSAELVGRFAKDRAPLAAIALSANPAFLTAWSNDVGFDDVFARQVDALGRREDVALGISTSGTSQNVVNGWARARARGLRTIGLTGQGGGRMREHCDVLMAAPCTETARVQEVHLATYHAICAALESRLFDSGRL
jgi:D-sedoheptulose 7-phosphate isomerase